MSVRKVHIKEDNAIAKSFNTQVEYSTDSLPEWFQGLRQALEDRDFRRMTIQIRDVHYIIMPVGKETDVNKPYACYTCGKSLSFPETLFYQHKPYCFDDVPEYRAEEQF